MSTTVEHPHVADDRSADLVSAHDALALASLNGMNQAYAKIARDNGLPIPELPASPYQYKVMVGVGGLLFLALSIDFTDTSVTYGGIGGGLAIGAGASWGTAYFNYPLDQIKNWDARFELNWWAVATNINLWGMKGEVIGSTVAGGLGLGSGIAGGKGSFSS